MRVWLESRGSLCGGTGLKRPAGRARDRRRRGAALVEFAVVAPLLFLLILTIIELGRLVMVQQILTNAAREGARRGILEQTTADEVRTIVSDYLTQSSVPVAPEQVHVTPDPFDHVAFGAPITVAVTVPFDQVTWLPGVWSFSGITLSGQSTMSAERPE